MGDTMSYMSSVYAGGQLTQGEAGYVLRLRDIFTLSVYVHVGMQGPHIQAGYTVDLDDCGCGVHFVCVHFVCVHFVCVHFACVHFVCVHFLCVHFVCFSVCVCMRMYAYVCVFVCFCVFLCVFVYVCMCV